MMHHTILAGGSIPAPYEVLPRPLVYVVVVLVAILMGILISLWLFEYGEKQRGSVWLAALAVALVVLGSFSMYDQLFPEAAPATPDHTMLTSNTAEVEAACAPYLSLEPVAPWAAYRACTHGWFAANGAPKPQLVAEPTTLEAFVAAHPWLGPPLAQCVWTAPQTGRATGIAMPNDVATLLNAGDQVGPC
jgi:hypothetical protein